MIIELRLMELKLPRCVLLRVGQSLIQLLYHFVQPINIRLIHDLAACALRRFHHFGLLSNFKQFIDLHRCPGFKLSKHSCAHVRVLVASPGDHLSGSVTLWRSSIARHKSFDLLLNFNEFRASFRSVLIDSHSQLSGTFLISLLANCRFI